MNSIFKGTTAMAAGLLAFSLLGAPQASAGKDKHGTMDKKIVDCHEAHDKMKDGKMGGDHMKGCHDKDGKLIGNKDGHMGHDKKMPMGDHKMGDHKEGDHKMGDHKEGDHKMDDKKMRGSK